MQTIIKPLKRNVFLAPLSREHHDTLLFCWKINHGLRLEIKPKRIAEYCTWFFENHMKDHFQKEETAFTRILSRDNVMIDRMFDDHEAIKAKIIELNQCATIEGLKRLTKVVIYHVRFEERQLFQYVQEIATNEQLRALSADLYEKDTPNEWPDEFWVSVN